MSTNEDPILNDFNIFKNVDNSLKTSVKIFHIFRPSVNEENYVFFITKEDKVYAFGHNKAGILGLGHDQEYVPEYTLVKELCGKQINQFFHFNWSLCMCALSDNHEVYCWGSNYSKIENQDNLVVYLKPQKIGFFDDKNIVHLSGAVGHYLALSSNGEVFRWNDDCWGQSDGKNDIPLLLRFNDKVYERIKLIDTSIQLEMAITESDKFYCIGRSFLSGFYQEQIHQMTSVEDKLKNIKVKKVVTGGASIFILSGQGNIYHSEKLYPELKFYQVESDVKFIDIFVDENQLLCQTEESVYLYQINKKLEPTNYINFFEYYLEEYKATNGTIHIRDDGLLFTEDFKQNDCMTGDDSYLIRTDRYLYRKDNKLKEQFEVIRNLDSSNFGSVQEVKKIHTEKSYAVKCIWLCESRDPTITFREIRFLEKMNSNFVSKLITGWVEMQSTETFSYILMEYYQVNLEQIIKLKTEKLCGPEHSTLNYFLSTELFKELTECIDYSHSFHKSFLEISDIIPGRDKAPLERQSILHRDIKPKNIMISDGSDGRYLKLADFGLTAIVDESGNVPCAGTPKYWAPEEKLGLNSDIYSLGKIAEEIFDMKPSIDQNPDQTDNIGTDKINDKINGFLKSITSTIEKMTLTDPTERPKCKEILEVLKEVSIKSELNNCDLSKQKDFLKTLENPFFYKFLESKLKSNDNESEILTTNINERETLPSGSVETIEGLNDVLHRMLGSVNSGLNEGNFNSLFKEMFGCVMAKSQQELSTFCRTLITEAFKYSAGQIVINEMRIESIIKEWDNYILSLKMFPFLFEKDKQLLEMNPNDQTHVLYLKTPANQTKDLPQVNTDFETVETSSGQSAIFDAVSFGLYQTKEHSDLIRVLTFLIYFKFRKEFQHYCEIISENYQETLLKMIALPALCDQIKSDFKLNTTDITNEKSAILAIQLAIQRMIYLSAEESNKFIQFSINPFTRDFFNQRKIETPIWLCQSGNAFLTVNPRNSDIEYIPEEYEPNPDLSPIFANLLDCEEGGSAMAVNYFRNSLFNQIGFHEIEPGAPKETQLIDKEIRLIDKVTQLIDEGVD